MIARWFAAAEERARRACEQGPRVRLRLGGEVIAIHFASAALAEAILPGLALARDGADAEPALTIYSFDGSSGWSPDIRAWAQELRRYEIPELTDERFLTAFQPGPHELSSYDRERRVALHWLPSASDVVGTIRAAPFRFLLIWWGGGYGLDLVHAGAVGVPGAGVLLAGRGGSGKSTTTVACLAAGLDFASDDYVAVGKGAMHAVFASAKLVPVESARLSLDSVATRIDGEEKTVLFLQRVAASLPLSAVLLPRVSDAEATRLVPATSGEALTALAASTLFQTPYVGQATLARLAALLRGLPAMHLLLGRDRPAIPEIIADYCRTLAREA